MLYTKQLSTRSVSSLFFYLNIIWEDTKKPLDLTVVKIPGSQYYNFSNIRFGAPPIGDKRFAAPALPTIIDRTVNTGQQAVICPQASPRKSDMSIA
jgi:hypothetical protein